MTLAVYLSGVVFLVICWLACLTVWTGKLVDDLNARHELVTKALDVLLGLAQDAQDDAKPS